jgi:hypothetical protein
MARLNKEQTDIGELVRKAERDYVSGVTNISKYVQFSQYENIEKIDAYLNSKHTSGDKDSQGRDKPFFNIVTAAVNIWYRATDIDRKNIKIKASELSDRLAAYVATLHLQEWMRRTGFGAFLNEWGRSLARYGSSVLKFIEKDGKLIPAVIPWNRMISDTVDFENNPKIEILWMTPAQLLKNKAYDQDMVQDLLDNMESRETLDGQNKDNRAEYVKLYEIHGELPLSYLTSKKKDADEYVQQMQVLSFLTHKNGKFNDYCLYKGREAKDPYMITHLIKEDGRAQAIGAVEHLFEAQWMTNHTMKGMKDYLDVASKLIMQTSDGNFVGQNVLNAIENGDILIHGLNAPLTLINTAKPDITQLQNFGQQWQVLSKEIVATPDAISGITQPSGTAWRTVEAQRMEAHSLFELMTENKGLHIEDMLRKYVIPSLKKQMDTTDELVATLDSQGISQFDSMYVPNEAIRRSNEQIKKTVLSGQVASNTDMGMMEQGIKKELNQLGNQRFIKPSDINSTWKKELEDLEWDVEVEVTGESVDKQAVMATLTTVLQTIANPMTAQVLNTPQGKLVFNKILEETGSVSSLELAQITPTQPQMQQPSVGGSMSAQPTMGGQPSASPNGVPA